MKKIVICTLAVTSLLSISCARVGIRLTESTDKQNQSVQQKIVFDSAGGWATPERGLNILDQQADSQTYILLQKKLREAIKADDQEQVDKILEMMKKIENQGYAQEKYCKLKVKNNLPDSVITIESEPFAGITLNYGKETKHTRSIPVGILKFKYREYITGKDGYSTIKVNVSIPPGRTRPITIIPK